MSELRIRERTSAAPHAVTACILVAVVVANVWQLFYLPLVLLPRDPLWGLALVALAPLNWTLWSLIHETIHGNLTGDVQRDAPFGRALAVLHGAPFRVLRTGHLLHHRYSRTERERSEVYDPARSSYAGAAASYYFRLLGGLYFYEVLSAVLAFLPPRVVEQLRRRLDAPDSVAASVVAGVQTPAGRREAQIDALAIVSLYGCAAYAFGGHAWMLAGFLAMRAVLISLHDNVYHYATPLDDVRYAADLRAPAPLRMLLLNFNLHGAHHLDPRLTWRELAAEPGIPRVSWSRAMVRQLAGPIAVPDVPPRQA